MRKGENIGKSLWEKQPHSRNKNLITIHIKSSYPLTIQKFLFFSCSVSQDTLKTRVFRNNAIQLSVTITLRD